MLNGIVHLTLYASVCTLSASDGLKNSFCRYDSDDTPMREYANVHDVLQKKRAAALSAGSEGPRIMVRLANTRSGCS